MAASSDGRYRSVIVEADGGSRGNPGNAAYGAVLRDAETGAVIAERGERIGVATNNVAEYRGLIAGLHLYREYAEGADLEVRLDSKLVVEQMAGNWKIKHPSMRPLAIEANELAPFGTRFVWVPREQNKEADRLANEALDGPEGVVVGGPASADPVSAASQSGPAAPTPPWLQEASTTLVLVRHGETAHTKKRLFSGCTGSDPSLDDDGRVQVRATADWLAPLALQDPVLLSSSLRRARESAEIVAARLDLRVTEDEGLVEAGFGSWEGLSYAEVLKKDPDTFSRWMADPAQPAGGSGDSLVSMATRMERTRDRILSSHAGRVVIAVTHLTPIKLLTHAALEMPLTSLFRTEISPASVTVLSWYPDGRPVVRLLNGQPVGDLFDGAGVR
jgi:ribonuclease H / adenosylcobalamin/alpha-ribazole phosphatase